MQGKEQGNCPKPTKCRHTAPKWKSNQWASPSSPDCPADKFRAMSPVGMGRRHRADATPQSLMTSFERLSRWIFKGSMIWTFDHCAMWYNRCVWFPSVWKSTARIYPNGKIKTKKTKRKISNNRLHYHTTIQYLFLLQFPIFVFHFPNPFVIEKFFFEKTNWPIREDIALLEARVLVT